MYDSCLNIYVWTYLAHAQMNAYACLHMLKYKNGVFNVYMPFSDHSGKSVHMYTISSYSNKYAPFSK